MFDMMAGSFRRTTVLAATLAICGLLQCFVAEAVAIDDSSAAKQDQPKNAVGPPQFVFGVVLDPDGKPVEGADVVCGCSPSEFKPLTVRTTREGKFRFELPPKVGTRYRVITYAGKDGFAPAGKGHDVFSGDHKGKELRLELRKAGQIAGTVRDKAGKPVAGARVQYGSVFGNQSQSSYSYYPAEVVRGTPVERYFVCATDAEGRFRFTTVPEELRLAFQASANGMADLDVADDWVIAKRFVRPGDPPVELVMEAGARILGRVVSKVPGVDVAGIRIGVQGVRPKSIWKETRTDINGRFTITALSSHDVNVFPCDILNNGAWTACADRVTPLPGREVPATIELVEGVVVQGQVVTHEHEIPAAGVGVGIYGPARPETGAAILSSTTDAQGRFQFRLPPGKTFFYVYSSTPKFARLEGGFGVRRATVPEGAKTFTVPPLQVLLVNQ